MTSKIRLYFSDKIQSDLVTHLNKKQSHYIKKCNEIKTRENIFLFLIAMVSGIQKLKVTRKERHI